MREVSTYHMVLRMSSVIVAVVLLFDSGFVSPVSKEIANNTQEYLANAVGATASVAPNGINEITAKLTKQRAELDAREAALSERELTIGLNTAEEQESDMSTYILSLLLFIILVLIVLNYALDFARSRRLAFLEEYEQKA